MNKFLSIFCFVLLISTSIAKKSTTEQAAQAASELKDKVVETVRLSIYLFIYLHFLTY